MDKINAFIQRYIDWLYIPQLHITDIMEIGIISFVIYHLLRWFQKTRAWTLFKGIVVLLLFVALATVFRFNTILWILKKTVNIAVIAVIIIFQPEFRNALEQLGRRSFVSSLFNIVEQKSADTERISEATVNEIIKAVFDMAKVKTGALIVLEQEVALGDYENTGISVDALVTSQLLINIFEKNTPLHDGAVLIRKDRVVAATCYLPLSSSKVINKDLGTRHRAAIGISEVSDSLTIIVSEETGSVSVAKSGRLIRNLDPEGLKKQLLELNKHGKQKDGKKTEGRKGKKKA